MVYIVEVMIKPLYLCGGVYYIVNGSSLCRGSDD
jgi:hypothetical protein